MEKGAFQVQRRMGAYFGVIHLPDAGVGVDVRPHQGRDHADGRHGGRHLLDGFRFGRQAASSSFQAIRSHHCGDDGNGCYCGFNLTGSMWTDPGVRKLTFPHHADSQTLLEAAELASIPPSFVYRAVLVCQANILGIFLDRALRNKHEKESETHLLGRCAQRRFYYLEESFAALAGSYSVVLTGGVVAAHGTAALGPTGTF